MLALLALGVFAPQVEGGHCGGYVLGGTQALRDLDRLDHAGPSPSKSLPRVPACNGPSCSGQPASPITPVVAPAPASEDWACPLAGLVREPEGISVLAPAEPDLQPIHGGPSVFHPPRPAAATA